MLYPSKKKTYNNSGNYVSSSDAWFDETTMQIRREVEKASSKDNIDRSNSNTKKEKSNK